MVLPTGTNCFTIAEDRLRWSLSQSANVQSFLGAANATEALTSIFVGSAPLPANNEELVPAELVRHIVIGHATCRISKVGVPSGAQPSGILLYVVREFTTDVLTDPEQAFRKFKNTVLAFMEDLFDHDYNPSALDTLDVSADTDPYQPTEDEDDDLPWIYQQFNVIWGARGES